MLSSEYLKDIRLSFGVSADLPNFYYNFISGG